VELGWWAVTVLWTTDMSGKQVAHSETMRQLPELSRTEQNFTRQVCGGCTMD